MATDFLCGAGCEIVSPLGTPAAGAAHWTAAAGTPSILTSSDWPGGKAYRCAASGSAVSLTRTQTFTAGRVGFARMRVSTLPAAERIILRIATAANTIDFTVTSAGVLKAGVTGGTFQTGPTVTNTQIFTLRWSVVTNATTWTVDWSVDDVAQTQATRGSQTSGNSTSMTIGAIEASTYTVDFTDVVEATNALDHPLPDGYVKIVLPTGDGTHNVGSGAFRDSGGTAITGATTNAYTFVDDAVPIGSGTDYVEQQTNDGSAYLEFTLGTRAETQAPMAVCAVVAVEPSGGGACVSYVGLTNGTAQFQSINVQTATKSHCSVVFEVPRETTANRDFGWYGTYSWSQARVRWGYSTDASPDVRLHGIGIEAWYPKTTVTMSIVAIGPHDAIDGTRTSVSLTIPSGVLTNDVMYAFITKDYVNEAISAPGGWTLVGSRQDATTLHTGALYRRVAPNDSEPTTTYTWSWATTIEGEAHLIVVRGANTSTPEITQAGQANASSASIAIPALTATAQDMLLLGFAGHGRDTTIIAPPAGWVLADFGGTVGSTATSSAGVIVYKHNTAANPGAQTLTATHAAIGVAFQVAVGLASAANLKRFWATIVG